LLAIRKGTRRAETADSQRVANGKRLKNAVILHEIVVKIPLRNFDMLRFLNSVFCSSLQIVNSDLSHRLNPFGGCRQHDAFKPRERWEFCKRIC
jgi:hypothetical protein